MENIKESALLTAKFISAETDGEYPLHEGEIYKLTYNGSPVVSSIGEEYVYMAKSTLTGVPVFGAVSSTYEYDRVTLELKTVPNDMRMPNDLTYYVNVGENGSISTLAEDETVKIS